MKVDNFVPAPGKTVTIVVGVGAVTANLPAGGSSLELQNTGTVPVFVELFGDTPLAATVAASYPILPGQSKILDRKQGDVFISTISTVAAQNLFVTAGIGS